MPHVEIKYSDDVKINFQSLFLNIEQTINEMDASAGVCKSRAYPSSDFLHTHILVKIDVLKKPHRDTVFMQTLLKNIEQTVTHILPNGCYYSIGLNFSGEYYVTSCT